MNGNLFKKTIDISDIGYINVFHITSGELSLLVNDTPYKAISGDTIIINSFDTVTIDSDNADVIHFIFDSPKYFTDMCISPQTRFNTIIKNDSRIADICKNINHEYLHQEDNHEIMLQSLVSQLLVILNRHHREKDSISLKPLSTTKFNIVWLAKDYILRNCDKGITTSDVSNEIFVSSAYLCRCFKEVMGESVLTYADRIRCRKAKEDLSLGIYSVSKVAEKYNFASLSYFNRRYKRFMKESPSETIAGAKKKLNLK